MAGCSPGQRAWQGQLTDWYKLAATASAPQQKLRCGRHRRWAAWSSQWRRGSRSHRGRTPGTCNTTHWSHSSSNIATVQTPIRRMTRDLSRRGNVLFSQKVINEYYRHACWSPRVTYLLVFGHWSETRKKTTISAIPWQLHCHKSRPSFRDIPWSVDAL